MQGRRQVWHEVVVLVHQNNGLPCVFLDEATARTYLTHAGNTWVADTFEEFADKAGYNTYYCDMIDS